MNSQHVEHLAQLIIAPLEHMRRKNILLFVNIELFVKTIGSYERQRIDEIWAKAHKNYQDGNISSAQYDEIAQILQKYLRVLYEIAEKIKSNLTKNSRYN